MSGEASKFCAVCMKDFDDSVEVCTECGAALAVLHGSSLVGETLDDRYSIEEMIGKGGMGVVYRAKQRYLDREVALKVLRKDMSEDSANVKRFLQEARAISSLTSPHTVTVFDFGVSKDGLMYFTMELLDGESLYGLLRREGLVHYRRAVEFTVQACKSLAEAHKKQIWHRDIKPENVFVTRDEDGVDQVKILDFGIAKLGPSAQNLTATGMICGTPQYLSPEQAQGAEVDHRSDLYSLGVVLYEMLAGEPPFTGETAVKTVFHHVTMPPPPLLEKNPALAIPKELAEAVMWTLEKFPGDRPQTAESFSRALEEAVEAVPQAPPPPVLDLSKVPASEEPTDDVELIATGMTPVQTASFDSRKSLPPSLTELEMEKTMPADLDMPEEEALTRMVETASVEDDDPTMPADFDLLARATSRRNLARISAVVGVVVLVALILVYQPWQWLMVAPSGESRTPALVDEAQPASGGAGGEKNSSAATDHDVVESGVRADVAEQAADVAHPESVRIVAPPEPSAADVTEPAADVVAAAPDAGNVSPPIDVVPEETSTQEVTTEPAADAAGSAQDDEEARKKKERYRKERERRKEERRRKEKEAEARKKAEEEKKKLEKKEGGTDSVKEPDDEYDTIPVNPDKKDDKKKEDGEYSTLPGAP